jgi:YHS domain-containing protein
MTHPTHRLISATAALVFATSSAALANEIYATNGVAINGYDTVAYFKEHKPVKGLSKFSSTYKGAQFHFASIANRDAFAANPERYAPQYGGYCAYGTAEGHKATTQPQAFTVVGGKLYLNYNDDVQKTWRSDVDGYIRKANANWETVKEQDEP